ncbi:MAG: hypothetical protein GOV00_01900 [Candidatus Altiarchaeota archaeon]|nr:hypothetical protein [Candidatus Altiarchaeota archaeon]
MYSHTPKLLPQWVETVEVFERDMFEILIQEGFTEQAALKRLELLRKEFRIIQCNMDASNFEELMVWKNPDGFLKSMAVLSYKSPLQVDIVTTFTEIMESEYADNTYATKDVFRALSILDENLGAEAIDKILRSAIKRTDCDATGAYCLSLYFDKFLELSVDEELIDDVFLYIEGRYKNLTALVSSTRIKELPKHLRGTARKWTKLGKKISSEKITASKHLDFDVGSCSDMAEYHKEALFEEESPGYGKAALLYIDNELVGALKMNGHRSIIGLRTVENQGRYPIITGGFYATTKKITDEILNEYKKLKTDSPFVKIDLEELPIFPLDQWSPYNFEKTEDISHQIEAAFPHYE